MTIDEPDDSWLFAQLDDITVDESEIEDFSKLDDLQLLTRWEEVTAQIKELAQLLKPRTQSARDLHALRYAIQLELQRRGISIGLE